MQAKIRLNPKAKKKKKKKKPRNGAIRSASLTLGVVGFSSDRPPYHWVSWVFIVMLNWSPYRHRERRDEKEKS